jgi:hypothetical protein
MAPGVTTIGTVLGEPDAFYEADGGLFRPSELTRGPWDEGSQHAGPVAALIAGELERVPTPVQMLGASLHSGDDEVIRARAWRLRTDEVVIPNDLAPDPPSHRPADGEERDFFATGAEVGYHTAVAVAVADSGNGVSATLDWRRFLFINVDLTVNLHRYPAGEWVCLDATTVPERDGIGLADALLMDERGPIGRAAQTLLVAER